jgi:hypothetical protein
VKCTVLGFCFFFLQNSSKASFYFILFYFFGSAGAWTQGFELAGQLLCHLSHTSIPAKLH